MNGLNLDQGHDVFSHRGLGKAGWQVLARLEAGDPIRPARRSARAFAATLAATPFLRVNRATGKRLLGKLERAGLVIWRDDRALVRGPASLDEAARRLGVAGVQGRRWARHQLERAAYRLAAARKAMTKARRGRMHVVPMPPLRITAEACGRGDALARLRLVGASQSSGTVTFMVSSGAP
jgi:hypothetical protein